jgi:autotransporter-associated beta strand protein
MLNTGAITIDGGTLDLGGNTQNTSGLVTLQSGVVRNGTLFSNTQNFAGISGLVSAVLAGGVGLTKTTGGLLELTNANQYTGLTLVSAGTLLLSGGNDRLLNTGALTIDGGTLDLGGNTQNTSGLVTFQSGEVRNGTLLSNTHTFVAESGLVSAVLAGGVGLTKTTGGLLELANANLYTGLTLVSAGTLLLSGGNDRLLNTGSITIDGGTLDLGGNTQNTSGLVTLQSGLVRNGTLLSNSQTFAAESGLVSAVLAGTVGLTKTTDGLLTLSNANLYSGVTTVEAGRLLLVGDNRLLASTDLVVNGGTFDVGGYSQTLANLTLSGGELTAGTLIAGTFALNNGTVNAELAGTGLAVKDTTGLVTLNTAATFSGGLTIKAGTLRLGASERLLDSGSLTLEGGLFDLNGNLENVGVFTLVGGTVSGGSLVASAFNLQSGSVSTVFTGGAQVLKTTGGIVVLNSQNDYTGGTFIDAGVLLLGGTDRLPTLGAITLRGGTLDLGTHTQSSGVLTLQSGSLTGGVLTASDYQVRSGAVDAVLAGAGIALTKSTSGEVVLGGVNTYTGATTLNDGKLTLAINGALASATDVLVNNGAELALGSTQQTVASVTLNSGTLSGGTLTGTVYSVKSGAISSVLAGAGVALNKTTAGEVVLTGANTYTGLTTIGGGLLTLGVNSALALGTPVLVNGGTLAIGVTTQAVDALTLSSGLISGTGGTLTATSFTVESGSISAILAGAGIALNKTTTGEVVLTGANTYTGLTTLTAGKLILGVDSALALATNVVVNAGELALGTTSQTVSTVTLNGGTLSGGTLTGTLYSVKSGAISSVLAGTGVALNKTTDGEVLLTGANTYTGLTTVSGGTLTLGVNNALALGTSVLVNAGTLAIGVTTQSVDALTLSGGLISGTGGTLSATSFTVESGSISAILSGTAALTKATDGVVVLSGVNTYTGATTVNGGTLTLAVNNALALGTAVTVNAGELALGVTVQNVAAVRLVSGLISGGSLTGASYTVESGTVGSILSGSGVALTKNQAGTVLLSAANTYGGGTTINAGTLLLGASERLLAAGSVTLSGGTLDLAGFTQTTGAMLLENGSILSGTLSASGMTVQNGWIGAVLDGAGALTKTAAGTVTLAARNLYTGGTTLNDGRLVLAVADALVSNSQLNVNGGFLDLSAVNQTVGQLALTGGTVENGTLTLTGFAVANVASGSAVISADLAGTTASLTKDGAGTLLLSGNNSYLAGTTLNAGTLLLGAAERLANAGILTIAGGEFNLGGFTETTGALTLTGGRIFSGTLNAAAFGVQAGVIDAELGGAASLLKSGTGTVALNVASSYTGGTTITAGTLVLGASERLLDGGSLTVSGGLFDLGSFNETVNLLTLTGGRIANGTLTGSAYAVQAGVVDAVLAGGVALTKSGTGLVALNDRNLYTGGTTLEQGTLVLGVDQALALTGTLRVTGGQLSLGATAQNIADFTLDGGLLSGGTLTATGFFVNAGTISTELAGGAALVKDSAGVVTLNASNTYLGGTTITAGTLLLGASERLANAGSLRLNGGVLNLGGLSETLAAVTLEAGTITTGTLSGSSYSVWSGVLNANLAGSAALTKSTDGIVTLTTASSYSGGTTVAAGTLALGVDNALNAAGLVNVNGGELALGTTSQTLGAFTLLNGSLTGGTLSGASYSVENGWVSTVLSGSAALVKDNAAGTVTLSVASDYSGGTTVNAGTLALALDNALNATGAVRVTGGELALGTSVQAVGSFTLDGGLISGGSVFGSAYALNAGTVSTVLAGTSAMVKDSAGTVRLTIASQFSGGTTLKAGRLELGLSDALLTAGDFTLEAGVLDLLGNSQTVGVLTLKGGLVTGGTLTSTSIELQSGVVDSVLAGSVGVRKTTTGLVTLMQSNEYTGLTEVVAGTLQLGASERILNSTALRVSGGVFDLQNFEETVGAVTLAAGTIRGGTLTGSSYLVQSGTVDTLLSGTAALVKNGTGLVWLNARNEYAGGTTVNAGTLALGIDQALFAGTTLTIDGAGAQLALGATVQSVGAVTLAAGSLTGGLLTGSSYTVESGYVSTLLAGDGVALAKNQAGTVTLTAQNSYTGGTTLNAGTLSLAVSDALALTGDLTVNGGLLALGTTEQAVAAFSLVGGSLSGGTLTATQFTVESGTVSSVLAGTAVLTKNNAGTVLLNAANLYSEGTVLNAGTLLLGAAERLAAAGVLTLNGGVFNMGGFSQTTGLVTLLGGTLTNGVLTTGGSFALQAGDVSAVLAGAARLVKSGTGTVTLSGANSYTGGTFLEDGRLVLAGNNRLNSAYGVTLTGGVLDLGNATTRVSTLDLLAGTVEAGTLNASTAFTLGGGTVSAKLTGLASLTKSTDGTVLLSGASSYTGGTTINAGTLQLSGVNVLAAGGSLDLVGGVLDLGAESQAGGAVLLRGGTVQSGTLSSAAGFTLENGSVNALLAAGAAVKQTAGKVTLGIADTFAATTALSVSLGELDLGGLLTNAPLVTLTGGTISNGTLQSAAGFVVQSGSVLADLAGAGSLTKSSAGTVLLGGLNRYTGGTTLNVGSLLLGANEVLTATAQFTQNGGVFDLGGFSTGSGTYTLNGGLIRNGTLTATSFELGSGTVDALLAGTGRATKTTNGTVLLNGEIATSGDLAISGGTLLLGASDRINDGTRLLLELGGTLDLGGFSERVGRLQLRGGSVVNGLFEADIYEVTAGVVGVGLTGAAGLDKVSDGTTGGGLALFTAVNSYRGGTTVSAGTLLLGGADRLNTAGSLTVRGGTFDMGGYSQTVSVGTLLSGVITGGTLFATDSFRLESGLVSAVLAGTASLSKSGTGLVTLALANAYVGDTAVSAGTLQLLAAGGIGAGNALFVSGGSLRLGGVEQVASTVSLTGGLIEQGTLSSVALNLEAGRSNAHLTGAAQLVKDTTGTVTLGTLNSYSGGTWVKAGTLELLANGALSAGGTLLVDAGVLALGATTQAAGALTLNGGSITGGVLSATSFAVRSGVISSVLGGTASLVKSTDGAVLLSGQNQYSGDTTVEAGLLVLGGNQVLSATGALTLNSGTLDLGGAYLNSIRELTLNDGSILGGTGSVATLSAGVFLVRNGAVSAILTGTGALTKDSDGTVLLNGQNSYTGATTVNAGRLVLAGSQVLAQGAALTVNGGTLDLGGQFKNTVLSLTLNGGAIQQGTLQAGTFLLSSGQISSVLTGAAVLTKISAGTVTLSGQNTYTGETQVLGGRLVLGGEQVLSQTAALTVRNAALDLGGNFTNKVAVLTLDGGAISNGTLEAASMLVYSGTVSTVLGGSGALTKTGAGEVLLQGAATYTGGTALNAGVLRLAGDQFLAETGTVTITSGGTLDLGGYRTSTGALLLNGGVVRNGSLSASSFDLRSGIIDGVLSGAGIMTKSTVDTVLLNGLIAGSGDLVLTAGTFLLGAANRINDDTIIRIQEGATLDLGGFTDRVGGVIMSGGSVIRGTLIGFQYQVTSGVVGTSLAGQGGLEKVSDGTAAGGLALLTGVNTYTGATLVTAGTLQLGGNNRINAASYLNVQGGTFDLGGFSQDLNRGVLTTGLITNGTLSVNQLLNVQAGQIDTVVSGTGALTKTTDGTVLLTNVNSYSGGTTVTAGTLQLLLSGALGNSGPLRVEGGSLLLGGVQQAAGVVTLTGGVLAEGTLGGTAFNLSAGTVEAVLNGSGTLVKESAGTVLLNTVSGYTGGTRVDAGTLVLGVDGALTLNGALTVNGGLLALGTTTQTLGAVTLNGGALAGGTLVASAYAVRSGTVSSVLAGMASLVKTTDGLVTLSGLNRYEGNTTVDAGTLVLGGSNVLFASGALTVNGGTLDLGGAYQNTVGVLQLNGGQIVGGSGAGATITAGSFLVANGTISAVLAGDGSLTKNTAGTVFLKGQNTYTGLTTVNAGRLVLGGNQVLSGTAALQVNGGTLDLGGLYTNNVQTVTLMDGAIERGTIGAGAFNVFNGLISANLTGTGALTKNSAGTVTLSGQNSYTGETQVLGGRLVLGGNQVLSSSAAVTVRGGILDLGGDFFNQIGLLTLDGGALERGSLNAVSTLALSGTVAAVVAGSGSLTKESAGELVLQSASTYTGGTFLNAGTLRLAASERLADSGALTVSGGTFELGGFRQTLAEVRLLNGEIHNGTLAASAFTLVSGTVTAALAGAGTALLKTGSGTAVLNAAASYTGGTVVENGVLVLGTNRALAATGSLSITGGELALGTTAQTVGALSLTGGLVSGGSLTGSVYSVESGTVSSALAGAALLTKQGDGVVTLTGANTYSGRTQILGGTLRLAGVSVQTVSSGSVQVSGGRLELASGGQINVNAALVLDGGTFGFQDGVTGQTQTLRTILVQSGSLVTGANTLVGTGSTLTLSGGNTVVSAGGRIEDHHIILSGGTNVVAAGGSLVLLANPNTGAVSGLELIGRADAQPLLTLEGGATPARFSLGADLTVSGSGAAVIASTGTGAEAGQLVLGGGVRTVSVGSANSTAELVLRNVLVTGAQLAKTGTGTLSLENAQVAAPLALSQGTLQLSSGASVTGALSFAGGLLRYAGATADVSGAIAPVAAGQAARIEIVGGTVASFASGLGGAGSLVKTGAGVLTLNGTTSISGATFVNAGTLVGGVSGALANTSAITVSGATLQAVDYNGAATLTLDSTATATISGAGLSLGAVANANAAANSLVFSATSGTLTLAGLSGAGSTRFASDATVLSGGISAGTVQVAGRLQSDISGGLVTATTLLGGTVSGGVSTIGADAAVTLLTGGTTSVAGVATLGTVTGGILNLGGARASVNLLNGGTLNLGTTELTVAAGTTAGTITGATGSLVKTGAGVLTLNGTTSFGGTTLVNGGTLVGGVSGALANTSAITVSGATLRAVDYNGAATLTLDSTATATISGAGLSLGAVVNANAAADSLVFSATSGTLTLAGLSGAGTTRIAGDAVILGGGITNGTVLVAGRLLSDISGGTVLAKTLVIGTVSGGVNRIEGGASVNLLSGGTTSIAGVATLGTVSGGILDLGGASASVNLLGGGTLNLGTTQLTVAAGTTAGTITGATGSLVKTGAGVLTLNGTTSFGGTTLVNGGTLVGGVSGALANTSAITVSGAALQAVDYNGAATLTLDSTATATLSGAGLSLGAVVNANAGADSLVFSATSGTLTLAGLSGAGSTRFAADATVLGGGISAGTVLVAGRLQSDISGGLVTANALLGGTVSGGVSTIGAEAAVTLLTGGTTSVAGVATLGTVTGGILNLGGARASVNLLNGGTLNLGTTELTVAAGTTAGTITGATGSLVKTGAGVLTLNGTTSFGGTTLVNGGTLVGGVSGALANTSAITVSGATLRAVDYNGAATLTLDSTATATLSGAGLSLGAVVNANAAADSLVFSATSGTLTLAGLSGAGTTRFAADATVLAGGISAGTVQVAGRLQSDISGGVSTVAGVATLGTVSGGILNLGGASASVNLLNGGTLNLGTTELTVAAGTTAGTITGATGSLVKTGAGVLTLAGTVTFGGGTTVNAGSLVLAVNNALLSSGSVNVANGATLQLGTTTQNIAQLSLTGGAVTGGTLSAGSFIATSGTLAGEISGSGALVKTGDGTLVVSALNENFTGRVEILGGTLQLGNGSAQPATLGSLLDTTKAGAILNNGLLAFKFAPGTTGLTISNAISGTGSITYLPADGFTDAGYAVKFKGKNESTGGTSLGKGVSLDLADDSDLGAAASKLTLNGGTVAVGGTGTTTIGISATRTVELGSAGAAFSIGAGSQLNLDAKLTGGGSLTTTGAGTTVLTNSGNDYAGGNFVNSGTLQLGATGGTSGSLGAANSVVSLGAAGRLILKRRNGLVFTQTLTGSGSLQLDGGGTVTLTADNSGYTGAIVVTAGTLQLGEGSGTVALFGSGPIANGTEVRIARGGSLRLDNQIGGSGKLVLDGSNVASGDGRLSVNLTAKSTLTGETEIIGSTLKLELGASISNSAVLTIREGSELDVSAFANGYAIPAGQSLQGNGGKVRGNLALSGQLAPGNSPGSMTVGGIIVQPGAEYVAQFEKIGGVWKNDQIIIDGTLGGVGVFSLSGGTLDNGALRPGALKVGTVIATALSRVEGGTSYAIVSGTNGGTVDGAFAGVTGEFFRDWVDKDPTLRSQLQMRDPLAFGGTLSPSGPTAVLIPHLRYTASDVFLDIERKPFRMFGLGINAQEIGGYLDSFAAAPGNLLALQVQLESYKNAAEVTRALAGAGVSPYADLMSISRRRMLDMSSNVGSRLDLLGLAGARNGGVETMVGTGEQGWSVWQSNAVSQLSRKAELSLGFGGYTANGQSSLMGVERPFGAGRVGLLGAAGTTTSQFSNPSTKITSDSWHVGAYASLPVAPFFADIAFIFGNVENDARRTIEFPGYSASTRAKFNSDERVIRLGGGLQVMPAQSSWEMSVTEHILHVSGVQAALTERGGDVLAARTKKASAGGLLNEVGLTVGRRWVVRGTPVAVRLQANWLHDFDNSGAIQASFVGAPASAGWFAAHSAGGDRDALRTNGSVEIGLTERLSLRIGGEYERRKSSSKASLTISLGMEF